MLIADDNPMNLDVAKRILQSLGCEVAAAESGAAALEHFARDRFDIVLMDCEMPGMDGLEATRLARRAEEARKTAADAQTRRVPIIALTAHSADEGRDRCVAAGMDDFITKPLTKKKLQDTLSQWLGQTAAPPARHDRDASRPATGASSGRAAAIDTEMLSCLLNTRAGDAADFLGRLSRRFEELAPAHIAQLRQAHRDGQCEQMRQSAHSLKSTAGAIGACQLASRAGQIERHAKQHGLTGLEQMLAQLDHDLSAALEALRMFAGESHGTGAR